MRYSGLVSAHPDRVSQVVGVTTLATADACNQQDVCERMISRTHNITVTHTVSFRFSAVA